MEASERGNNFLNQVKAVNDSYELLDLMASKHHKDVEPHHVPIALNQLFALQKKGFNTLDRSQIQKHQGFASIINMIKFKSSQMEVNDLITTLKVLSFLGLKSSSIMSKRLLSLIKDNINDLSPSQLIFLNFMLDKMESTALVEALKIAVPLVFEINLSLKLDHDNQSELAEILHFISTSSMKITKKSMTIIFTALTIHGSSMSVGLAKSVIWSLCSLREFDESYERLAQNCIGVLNENYSAMSIEDLECTSEKMMRRMKRGDLVFYNEDFFNKTAAAVIERDAGFLSANFILKKMNLINFVNYDLLDYIDNSVYKNPSLLSSCSTAALISMASGFATANYKSEHWEIIKSVLLENPVLYSDKMQIPWMRFAVDLMSIGIYSNIMLEKLFNSSFIKAFLRPEENKLDQLQLLLLWQSVKLFVPEYDGPFPDQKIIDDAILLNLAKPYESAWTTIGDALGGKQFVQWNVATKYGHCLDCVVSFDVNDKPIAMPCTIKTYDELPKSKVRSVAVFLHGRGHHPSNYPEKLRGHFELRKKTIEALGITTVNISTSMLNGMKESEKGSFIEREIRYSLRQVQ